MLFVNYLHTDPVFFDPEGKGGLNWNMGYTLCSAF